MFAAAHPLLPTFHNQRLEQRYGFQVRHFHRAGEADDVVQLIHLAHRFVEDGGDDSAVRMRRWAYKSALQQEVAYEALSLLI